MMIRLAASIMALIAVGSVAVAQGTENQPMSLEKAIELHRSGEFAPDKIDEHANAVKRVKQDIKACLTFYELTECTGPAEKWAQAWSALELPPPSAQHSTFTQPSVLPSPFPLYAPFTKSAVDFFVEMHSPTVGATR